MARPRSEFSEKLKLYSGLNNQYFQPKPSVAIKYPCILYYFEGEKVRRADNKRYFTANRYRVTVVTTDADSKIHEKILEGFTDSKLSNVYCADGLYHFVLTIYF